MFNLFTYLYTAWVDSASKTIKDNAWKWLLKKH